MNQKFEDIKLFVKNDRRAWAAIGLIGVILIVWQLTSNSGQGGSPNQRMRRGQVAKTASPQGSGEEQYRDLIAAMQKDIDRSMDQSKHSLDKVERLANDAKANNDQLGAMMETMTNTIAELSKEMGSLRNANQGPAPLPANGNDPRVEQPDSLEPLGFDQANVPPPPPAPARPLKVSVISATDSVSVKLLSGVNAPVDGTPYPVIFRVDGPITGADGSTLDVGEARILAAATGSETDGRVNYRLTNIALRHSDGRRSVIDVDGWITGEDGMMGMKGKLVDKLGRLILATAGVGFAGGLAESIEQKNRLSSLRGIFSGAEGVNITDSDLDFATASAFTDTTNRLGQILLDRYEKLVPVVEILPGRDAIAVFSRTSEVSIIADDDGEGIYAASSMD